MLNVSALLSDPDFAQPLTINRATGAFVLGGFTSTPAAISAGGVVDVASERELAQVPEGDRVTGAMAFYVAVPVYLTQAGQTTAPSDTITWRGDTYRLVKIWPYADYGYYKAVGVRMSGE